MPENPYIEDFNKYSERKNFTKGNDLKSCFNAYRIERKWKQWGFYRGGDIDNEYFEAPQAFLVDEY